jgi:hypothetical protein
MQIENQSEQQRTMPFNAKNPAFFANLPEWTCHGLMPLQVLV